MSKEDKNIHSLGVEGLEYYKLLIPAEPNEHINRAFSVSRGAKYEDALFVAFEGWDTRTSSVNGRKEICLPQMTSKEARMIAKELLNLADVLDEERAINDESFEEAEMAKIKRNALLDKIARDRKKIGEEAKGEICCPLFPNCEVESCGNSDCCGKEKLK